MYYTDRAKEYSKMTFSLDFAKEVHKGMKPFLPSNKNANILDIGCGSGRDANFLISKGFKQFIF